MSIRSFVRGTASLALVLAGDLARWGGSKLVSFLFSAPTVDERPPANPGLPEDDERTFEPTADEFAQAKRDLDAIRARPPLRSVPPPEDNPSNQVLVGSLEWRRQQGRR